MTDGIGTVAENIGETLIWSDLGGGELVVALVVGLVLLAFAFPARSSGSRPSEPERSRMETLSRR